MKCIFQIIYTDIDKLDCCLQDASTSSQVKELKLPIALEKVLAFKDVRVSQVGMKPEDLERIEKGS